MRTLLANPHHSSDLPWVACWERVVAGRPAAEVAAELGVSVADVYSATYRLIRRLRSELAGAWG